MSEPPVSTVDDLAVPLDVLLVDAAFGPLRMLAPDVSAARLAGRLATRPRRTGRRLLDLAAELGRVGAGTSALAPAPRDPRFADPAWASSPLLRRVTQAYLAFASTMDRLIADGELNWRDERRVRFLSENVIAALAPSNVPLLNPASAKAAVDSGGLSLLRGGLNLVRDLALPPRVPRTVPDAAFRVGTDLAATPGAVVLRTEVFELIQYAPQTTEVRTVPLVLVPPTINKYYAIDLAPDRSWVEHLVRAGQQVFVLSWRNPDARHAEWGLDRYLHAVLDALDAAERICGTERTVLAGICSGGTIASLVAGHLAGSGGLDRLAGFGLAVTVLDQFEAGTPAALAHRYLTAAATAVSRSRGYLDGRTLAEIFAWLRPADLVWHYWVNNYLLGRPPPAFDVLFWNADTTRMSAGLHADLVDLAVTNRLVEPGGVTALGVPVDLGAISVDSYVVAGIADHITPWQSCYRTANLLGGRTRFVLSTSGHIAALVNPPGNPKASYRVGTDPPRDATRWLESTAAEPGSWWPDFAGWLDTRCGPQRPAPTGLGSRRFPPIVEAPGTYVFDR
ncbi:PHA/PHB synthase family protein [Virgisporangium aurantiacum]|uniref:Class II poly(R)-hydroxyalkanoic acid synthase n=1 Tax=Virgisporangium aurantiacum TaxID=175570 RepID=A0A8J3YYK5_9ACTN|nr:alpha/beta fold hydrolase [Virgisporangium aurantiacum]GIJ54394.1 class II poly(R)-hydroxyalkanoic acid synthase [Virgisporangium aurantiacum]